MERNITIGLIIAFLLVGVGAFIMQGKDDGAGILIDFLKNHTNKTDINSTINETINQTISENITDNSTAIGEISFDAIADYNVNNSILLISVNANKENITVNEIAAFISYDDANFTEAAHQENVTLPALMEISNITQNATVYYYLDIVYNGTNYRLPAEGAYNITT